MGVGLIIGAIIALLNNVTGVKSGGSMPEQAGERAGAEGVVREHDEAPVHERSSLTTYRGRRRTS